MKTLYTAFGAALIFFIGLRLHLPVKFLLLFITTAALYISYPALNRYFKLDPALFDVKDGSISFHAPPSVKKTAVVAICTVIVFFAAVKLHINLKLLLLPLGAGVIYIYYPLLHGHYHSNALPYHEDSSTLVLADQPLVKNPLHFALGVIAAFIISFELHLKFLMYPLAAAIFYLYVPLLFLNGKKYALQFAREGEPANYFSYLWFASWFAVSSFLSYMLAHLLTDIVSSFNLHIFRTLLILFFTMMIGGIVYIWRLQSASKNIVAYGDMRTNFEKQGRLASFVVLLILLSYFLLKH